MTSGNPSRAFPTAFLFAGTLLLACTESPDSASSHATSSSVAPSGDAARARLEEGRELATAGRIDDAIAAFREATRLDPNLADAWAYLGSALVLRSHVTGAHDDGAGSAPVSLGRDETLLEEGIASLQRAVELAPEDPAHRYELGRLQHVGGRTGESIATLTQLVARHADHGAGYKRLGLAYLEDGDLEAAGEALRRAEALLPEDPGVPYQLGNALLEEDPAGARDAFRRAIAVDPAFPPPYHGLVGVLARLGDAQGSAEAKQAFERWRRFQERSERAERRAEKRPQDVEAQLAVGELFLRKALPRRAAPWFQRALALDPRAARAHLALGTIADEVGEPEAARNHLEEALYLTPEALEPRLALLRHVHRSGASTRRDELLEELLAREAALSNDERLRFAEVLLAIGRTTDARRQLAAVPEGAPEHAAASELRASLEGNGGTDEGHASEEASDS